MPLLFSDKSIRTRNYILKNLDHFEKNKITFSSTILANYRVGTLASYLKNIPNSKLGHFIHCGIGIPQHEYSNFGKVNQEVIVCVYVSVYVCVKESENERERYRSQNKRT